MYGLVQRSVRLAVAVWLRLLDLLVRATQKNGRRNWWPTVGLKFCPKDVTHVLMWMLFWTIIRVVNDICHI